MKAHWQSGPTYADVEIHQNVQTMRDALRLVRESLNIQTLFIDPDTQEENR